MRVFEGRVGMWCDECDSQYLDDGGMAKDQKGPSDRLEGWFAGLSGRLVRVTIEVLDGPDLEPGELTEEQGRTR